MEDFCGLRVSGSRHPNGRLPYSILPMVMTKTSSTGAVENDRKHVELSEGDPWV